MCSSRVAEPANAAGLTEGEVDEDLDEEELREEGEPEFSAELSPSSQPTRSSFSPESDDAAPSLAASPASVPADVGLGAAALLEADVGDSAPLSSVAPDGESSAEDPADKEEGEQHVSELMASTRSLGAR